MKKAIFFFLAAIQITYSYAQQTTGGTVVIVGFDNYDNRNLYGLLDAEQDGVLSLRFLDDKNPCTIDRQGNVLSGNEYVERMKPGKSIVFIQIYEKMKWIGSPEEHMGSDLSVEMLIVTKGGDTVFANSEYSPASKSFAVQAKPSLKTKYVSIYR